MNPNSQTVVLPREVADYCLESAMMLRKRLEVASNSPEYKRVCEVQTALEDALSGPDRSEWASAIEDAEQVMIRWGHGQVRRVPDKIVKTIVAAMRAPVSERGTLDAALVPFVAAAKRMDGFNEGLATQVSADCVGGRQIFVLDSIWVKHWRALRDAVSGERDSK